MVMTLTNILLAAVLVAILILIFLLVRLTDTMSRNVGETAKLQEERLDRLSVNLDQKLAGSINTVSTRLEEVHQGLGNMQSLAVGVGDLKKVLTNVKNRGIWGEMQLGNLLKDMLSPEQYGENIAVRPRGSERVEYAIKLPGANEGEQVWLPIDAKFPQEDYQRLLVAREKADEDEAAMALKQLEIRFKGEAKDIRDKYICPPYSTDFAIMYLPLEGLFAEAVNIPGLLEELQRKYRVTVAGPTTLAALINSLQMGFKTLAIAQQTSEAWKVFTQLENDFVNLESNLDRTQKKLQELQNAVEQTTERARVLRKRMAKAQEITKPLDREEE
jgi:DNA recombination protein RmuC